jgi:hypothetical protein
MRTAFGSGVGRAFTLPILSPGENLMAGRELFVEMAVRHWYGELRFSAAALLGFPARGE